MDKYIERIVDGSFKKEARPEWFCESSELSLEDQKWIYYNINNDCHSWGLSKGLTISEDCINGSCKPEVNSRQTLNYLNAIYQLKTFDYNAPPIEISKVLEEFLGKAEEGHWLWIAQRWCPRPIIQVLNSIVRQIETGQIKVKNPGAYFTYLIKFRKRRKRARRKTKNELLS